MAEPGSLRMKRVAYGDPDATFLVDEVQTEYVARYGGPDQSPIDPKLFEPPLGSFFVGYDGPDHTEPVATGAWRRSSVEVLGAYRTAEIKRMYVVPHRRGRGLSRLVLAHLESSAAESGVEALVLETGLAQPEAIALYLSSGYVPVPAFGFYKESPLSRCFAKDLRELADR